MEVAALNRGDSESELKAGIAELVETAGDEVLDFFDNPPAFDVFEFNFES